MIKDKKSKFFYGYIILIATICIMLIGSGAFCVFGVFLKPLSTDLGWTRATISGAYSLMLLLTGLTGIVVGGLNDRFGPRILLTACGLILCLGFLLMSQITAIWQLYLFYGVMVGIGISAVFVPLLSTVARWFDKRRGLMTGIASSGMGVGGIILPPLAIRLIIGYGWRTSYVILGIMFSVIVLVAQFLKRQPSEIGQLPDGASEVKEESLNSEVKGLSLREAIHTRQFWLLCTLFICHSVGQGIILVHIVPYATDVGISAILAANIIAIVEGVSSVGRVVMGTIADRIGNKRILVAGLIPVTFVLLWLPVVKELWMFYLAAAIFGIGFGGVVVTESPIVAELFGMRAHGAIFGVVLFSVTTGIAIGSVLSGGIFDITGSYYLAFLVCAGLGVISFILGLLLKPISR